MAPTIWPSVSPDCATSCEPWSTRVTLAWISVLISLAAVAERPARLRTSEATTAKPRPCSPARAASTAALSASRFVWKAMSSITLMMSTMRREASLIEDIASIARDTTAPPFSAWSRAAIASWFAWLAFSALWRDGAGHLVHGRRRLLQRRGLALGALGKIAVALADLGGAPVHFAGGLLHFADEARHVVHQLVDAGADGGQQARTVVDRHALREVAAVRGADHLLHFGDHPGDVVDQRVHAVAERAIETRAAFHRHAHREVARVRGGHQSAQLGGDTRDVVDDLVQALRQRGEEALLVVEVDALVEPAREHGLDERVDVAPRGQLLRAVHPLDDGAETATLLIGDGLDEDPEAQRTVRQLALVRTGELLEDATLGGRIGGEDGGAAAHEAIHRESRQMARDLTLRLDQQRAHGFVEVGDVVVRIGDHDVGLGGVERAAQTADVDRRHGAREFFFVELALHRRDAGEQVADLVVAGFVDAVVVDTFGDPLRQVLQTRDGARQANGDRGHQPQAGAERGHGDAEHDPERGLLFGLAGLVPRETEQQQRRQDQRGGHEAELLAHGERAEQATLRAAILHFRRQHRRHVRSSLQNSSMSPWPACATFCGARRCCQNIGGITMSST